MTRRQVYDIETCCPQWFANSRALTDRFFQRLPASAMQCRLHAILCANTVTSHDAAPPRCDCIAPRLALQSLVTMSVARKLRGAGVGRSRRRRRDGVCASFRQVFHKGCLLLSWAKALQRRAQTRRDRSESAREGKCGPWRLRNRPHARPGSCPRRLMGGQGRELLLRLLQFLRVCFPAEIAV